MNRFQTIAISIGILLSMIACNRDEEYSYQLFHNVTYGLHDFIGVGKIGNDIEPVEYYKFYIKDGNIQEISFYKNGRLSNGSSFGDEIASITKEYLPDTTWIRFWNANGYPAELDDGLSFRVISKIKDSLFLESYHAKCGAKIANIDTNIYYRIKYYRGKDSLFIYNANYDLDMQNIDLIIVNSVPDLIEISNNNGFVIERIEPNKQILIRVVSDENYIKEEHWYDSKGNRVIDMHNDASIIVRDRQSSKLVGLHKYDTSYNAFDGNLGFSSAHFLYDVSDYELSIILMNHKGDNVKGKYWNIGEFSILKIRKSDKPGFTEEIAFYDNIGSLQYNIEAGAAVLLSEYDSFNNLVRLKTLDENRERVENEFGYSEVIYRYNRLGYISWRISLDKFGTPITNLCTDCDFPFIHFIYDSVGNLIMIKFFLFKNNLNPLKSLKLHKWHSYEYNSDGFLSKINYHFKDSMNLPDYGIIGREYIYDELGHRLGYYTMYNWGN